MIFYKLWKNTVWSLGRRLCLGNIQRNSQTFHSGMELSKVVEQLKKYAPLSLAESWDNVGLLVEPSTKNHVVRSLLLTNDLTENVMEESIQKSVNMIISYHPPIFSPFKSLTKTKWKERVILKAVENKIAIYSPHTAFDSVNDGINDWLASGLGKGIVEPLETAFTEEKRGTHRVTVLVSKGSPSEVNIGHLVDELREVKSVISVDVTACGNDYNVNINCNSASLVGITKLLNNESPELLKETNIFTLDKMPIEGTGIGRLCTLEKQVSVQTLVERIKVHLKLKNVRLALANKNVNSHQNHVKTIALCAGSGGSVLKGVKADMYLTGEMPHHEVLDAVSRGIHVVLCDHSNTERGFFTDKFKDILYDLLESKVEILISDEDCDPISIV